MTRRRARIPAGGRLLGLVHTVTGLWLMYLTFATVLDITSGHTLPHA